MEASKVLLYERFLMIREMTVPHHGLEATRALGSTAGDANDVDVYALVHRMSERGHGAMRVHEADETTHHHDVRESETVTFHARQTLRVVCTSK